MAAKALLVVAVAAAALVGTALGTTYTVGAPGGSWDLKTDYARWASGVRLSTGDELRFQYPAAAHNVVEVSKAGYDACNGSSPVATFPTGDDVVPLAAAGTRYFICGVPGHCAAGMKLQVDVTSRPLRCRRRGIRSRCSPQSTAPSSSAAAPAGGDRSAAARLGLAAVVVAGLMLLY